MDQEKFKLNDINYRLLLVVAIVGMVLVSATAPALAVQGNETTANESSEPADAVCEPGANEPEMEQARLHASDTTVETGSPGRISGGFQVSPTANCPVVVHITMSVPSGVTISGGSDFTSSGAGMVTSRFTVSPGANIKDIAAEVYSDETGERTVTADIQYWPEGHEDRSREIDGLSFTFDVEEPTTPNDESNAESDDANALSGGFTTPAILGVLLSTAAVLIARSFDR